MVLKTAPARPWVFGLNESAMIKLATVKITEIVSKLFSRLNSRIDYRLLIEGPEGQPKKHNTTMTSLDQ
jgi:hypothetical protein